MHLSVAKQSLLIYTAWLVRKYAVHLAHVCCALWSSKMAPKKTWSSPAWSGLFPRI